MRPLHHAGASEHRSRKLATRPHLAGLAAFLVSGSALGRSGSYWVIPEAYVSPLAADAGDAPYDKPAEPWLIGGAIEAGFSLSAKWMPSLAAEFEYTLDLQAEGGDSAHESTQLAIPLRFRFLGVGDDSARLFLMAGLGYAILWEHNQEGAAGASDLRSAGVLFELGASCRFQLDRNVFLELGLVPRMQMTRASNGVGDSADAPLSRLSVHAFAGVPLSF